MSFKSLITEQYFRSSRRYIPNVNETEFDKMDIDLNDIIQVSEKEIEKRAFGFKMYRDFVQYVDNGGLTPNAPQNYKDIVYGKDYTVTGKNGEIYDRSWIGLIDKDSCYNSLIADYVHYKYWENNITNTTDMGEVKNIGKVSNVHSMSHKLSNSWNRFIDVYQGGYNELRHHYNGCGYSLPYTLVKNRLNNGYGINYNTLDYANYSGEVSLITFLHDNKDVYPLLDQPYLFDKGFDCKNSFGL